MIDRAEVAWSTRASNVRLATGLYRYQFDFNPLDPNEPGAYPTIVEVGDWFLDYSGYPFLIEEISGNTLTVYDVNERGNGTTSAYGPYNNMIGYVYRPVNGAFMLNQAQLRKLDASAADVINNIEKGVIWKYRGLSLADTTPIDNITNLELENIDIVDVTEEGWQGGKKVKLRGGVEPYTNLTPMPNAVGGYEAGTTFDNVAYKDLIDGLLYPYQYPAFSSFSISGQATTLECGVAVSGSSRTFSWGTTNPSNVASNSITIRDTTNSLILAQNITNDGSEVISFTDVVKTVTAQSNVWKIEGKNTKDQTFSETFTVVWYDPFYYGVGNKNLTVSQVQQLTKSVTAKGNKTFSFSPNNQVYYFAYPQSYGLLVSILDTNGFEIKNDFTVRSETFTPNETYFKNTVNVPYYVYEFNNLTTQTNFNITFKFS